ncbi:gacGG [Symbiodinium sp. CCMP2456]|nr:gacGG [Symbiodinium sp. CCMP2456]
MPLEDPCMRGWLLRPMNRLCRRNGEPFAEHDPPMRLSSMTEEVDVALRNDSTVFQLALHSASPCATDPVSPELVFDAQALGSWPMCRSQCSCGVVLNRASSMSRSMCSAILGKRFVVTWGDSRHGFGATLVGGSVVTWSHSYCGGDKSAVQDQLKHVQQIQATVLVFATVLGDGSVRRQKNCAGAIV